MRWELEVEGREGILKREVPQLRTSGRTVSGSPNPEVLLLLPWLPSVLLPSSFEKTH